LVAGELIAGEETAEKSDRDLEILYVDIAVEREFVLYQGAGAIGLGIEMHENQGVERIDWSHEKGLAIPIVRCTTQWLERVVSPCVTLVITPGVKAFRLCTGGELGGMGDIAGMATTARRKKAEQRK
jgi:hypothetical protein